jgi:dTDP-4-amino-4,6-dideoxygalactose transaminase
MKEIPILDLKAQYQTIRSEVQEAIERVLESQQFILGTEVDIFERQVAEYSGCQFGIGVSSGTDALLVSLMALGIAPGDEVITSAYSFFATAGCIARLGAQPVFVDIDLETLNINASLIAEKITPRTKGILPVHLAGQMADMDAIMDIASHHNLFVIEDACQSIGADYHGQRAGSIGQFGCFSFFPSKNLGGYGDSGLVTTNDAGLADNVKLLRNHGSRPKYFNQVIGGNFRIDALQAAILRVKLPHLEGWTAARQRNAALYRQLFLAEGLASEDSDRNTEMPVTLPRETGWGRHIYHLFQIRAKHRNELQAYLKDHGISTEIYYPVPLHLQACFSKLGYKPGDCPNAEKASVETLALPVYPELTSSMITYVVETIRDFYKLVPVTSLKPN